MGTSFSFTGSICNNPPTVGSIIGSGSFGVVFAGQLATDDVIKAFIKEKDCSDASDEYKLQKGVWKLFDDATKDRELEELASRIVVSKPVKFCAYKKKGYSIGGKQYGCFLVMSRLNGSPEKAEKYTYIPKAEWTYINSNGEEAEEEKGQKQEALPGKKESDLMIHASLNPQITKKVKGNQWPGEHGFFGKDWTKKEITAKNLRGYFITKAEFSHEGLFHTLHDELNDNGLSRDRIEEIIGFAYGYMVRGGYLPIDMECVFSYDPKAKQWNIAILDFGKVLNIAEAKKWPAELGAINTFYENKGAFALWQKSGGKQFKAFADHQLAFWIPRTQYGDVNSKKNKWFRNGFKIGTEGGGEISSQPIGMGRGISISRHSIGSFSVGKQAQLITEALYGKHIEEELSQQEEKVHVIEEEPSQEVSEESLHSNSWQSVKLAHFVDYGDYHDTYKEAQNGHMHVMDVDYRTFNRHHPVVEAHEGYFMNYYGSFEVSVLIVFLLAFCMVIGFVYVCVCGLVSGFIGFFMGKKVSAKQCIQEESDVERDNIV